jgi:UDP-N-acetyl-D-glucosamine dehydrogenase
MRLPPKIQDGSAIIGVIGLGYVGLPLLHAFHNAGFRVMGFDVDPKKIDALRRGENYLKHLGSSMVKDMVAAGRFDVTDDFARPGRAGRRHQLRPDAAWLAP